MKFFLKRNAANGILPYLCLPVKKQILISFILISEFISIWIWGYLFAYLFIFHKYLAPYGNSFYILIAWLTFFILLLFNNYSIYLIKILMKEYSILLFPVFLLVIPSIQRLIFIINPIVGLFLSCFLLFSIIIILNIVLKRDLYKELNNFTC
jgi:hypothetical protein